MADYVPFVNSDEDLERFRTIYSDAKVVRFSLARLQPAPDVLQHVQTRLWIDPGLDGYHCLLTGQRVFPQWKQYVSGFEAGGYLADAEAVRRPAGAEIRRFVFSVLDRCNAFQPYWITVPQLPVVEGTTRNRANRELAQAAGEWKSRAAFSGQMILPIVFTHQDQLSGRTSWTNAVTMAAKCYADAGAAGFWAVDSELDDQRCRAAFQTRFQAMVRFHEDLRFVRSGAIVVGGPYWGMNLVLWARQLCDYPAIGLGSGYRYMISGRFVERARKWHVALPSLRRWAEASPELKTWLDQAVGQFSADDVVRKGFADLRKNLDMLVADKDAAKGQVATSYKDWFRRIETVSPGGRRLALFQDLASAYVLGKLLPRLPKSESPGRDAGKVAEQLMLRCL